jgi:hypothetical protein
VVEVVSDEAGWVGVTRCVETMVLMKVLPFDVSNEVMVVVERVVELVVGMLEVVGIDEDVVGITELVDGGMILELLDVGGKDVVVMIELVVGGMTEEVDIMEDVGGKLGEEMIAEDDDTGAVLVTLLVDGPDDVVVGISIEL